MWRGSCSRSGASSTNHKWTLVHLFIAASYNGVTVGVFPRQGWMCAFACSDFVNEMSIQFRELQVQSWHHVNISRYVSRHVFVPVIVRTYYLDGYRAPKIKHWPRKTRTICFTNHDTDTGMIISILMLQYVWCIELCNGRCTLKIEPMMMNLGMFVGLIIIF